MHASLNLVKRGASYGYPLLTDQACIKERGTLEKSFSFCFFLSTCIQPGGDHGNPVSPAVNFAIFLGSVATYSTCRKRGVPSAREINIARFEPIQSIAPSFLWTSISGRKLRSSLLKPHQRLMDPE